MTTALTETASIEMKPIKQSIRVIGAPDSYWDVVDRDLPVRIVLLDFNLPRHTPHGTASIEISHGTEFTTSAGSFAPQILARVDTTTESGFVSTATLPSIPTIGLLNEEASASDLALVLKPSDRQKYLQDLVEVPIGLGMRHEPIIRGKGVPVWIIVAYIEKQGLTADEVSEIWNGYISPAEVLAAELYKRKFPDLVEDRLENER